MRLVRDEKGQVLVITALCMTALMGFVALAVDVRLLFRAQRNLQTAADAAAIAGALDYLYTSAATATTAASSASTSNGFTNGTGGVVVTVSAPAADGPNAGVAGFVEVVITQPDPTIFMSTFSMLLGAVTSALGECVRQGGGRLSGGQQLLRIHPGPHSFRRDGASGIVRRHGTKLRRGC